MAINWKQYPPTAHDARLKEYARSEGLFLAQHQTAFKVKTGGPYQLTRYVVANFAGILSTLSADLLFGEPPDFLVADEGNEATSEALSRLVRDNEIPLLGYEAALAASFRGDAVLKVRWGKRTPRSEEPEAIIEEVPATIYFPETSEDDVRQVIRASLAWLKVDPSDPKHQLVRVEEHEPGIIRNRLFRLSNTGGEVAEVAIGTLEEYADLDAEVQTGLDHIPLFHVPNFRYGSRFWGISDYIGLESLMESLNSRLSQIDAVLDKHVAPKLTVPPSLLDEDGKIDRTKLEIIPLEAGEQPPSYITWDAHLTAAFEQVDRFIQLLFLLSETGPSIFGLEKYGVAESGTALRLRLIRTLAKINRKRLYFDRALKKALYTAQLLEQKHGGAAYEPLPVSIAWADGLPEDTKEMAEIETQRLMAGNTSVESSVRRLDGADAVSAELDRIAGDQGQAIALTGAGGRRGEAAQPPAEGEE